MYNLIHSYLTQWESLTKSSIIIQLIFLAKDYPSGALYFPVRAHKCRKCTNIILHHRGQWQFNSNINNNLLEERFFWQLENQLPKPHSKYLRDPFRVHGVAIEQIYVFMMAASRMLYLEFVYR